MHVTINVKFPSNISKWQMGFNSAFKGLRGYEMLKDTKMTFVTGLTTLLGNKTDKQL
jgi:hypothetical protein